MEVGLINIGVDIGGRHTSIGIIDEEKNIIKREDIFYTKETFDIEKLFAKINNFIKENEEQIDSIGIGVPGLANDTYINYACNLPIKDVEVTDYIKTRVPIYVTNDANCATIAEYEIVDKKMYSNYILVTIGTGIGSGIILNENLFTGSTGTAGEIGHMVIEKDGIACSCGRRGCFEKYASISALLKELDLQTLDEVFHLAEKNILIENMLDNYLSNLATGLANIINIFDPEILVLGGSLSEYEDKFLSKLKTLIAPKLYNKFTYDLNIKIAKLGNDAGILGASMLEKYM